MKSRWLSNIFIFVFALGTMAALVKYTKVMDNGFSASLQEGISNIERIIWGKPPSSELSSVEKKEIVGDLDRKSFDPFYCGSTFFPFIPGANWNYQSKSGADNDVIRIGIPAVENGRTYLDGQLSSRAGWTSRTIAICEGGKIRLTDLNFLLIFSRDRVVTTPCQSGQYNFTMPKDADLIKGNGWLEGGCLTYDTLDENNKKVPPEIKETLEVRGKILGEESVVVPAGTFTAEKIELALSGRQEIEGNTKTIESTIDFWVSQGIGVVRSVYQEKNTDRPNVVQELSGYQIPSL